MKIQASLGLLLLPTATCPAAEILVDPAGAGGFSDLSEAVAAAEPGDTVLVRPGEYTIAAPLDFAGKAIALRSQAGPEQTAIRLDPQDPSSVRASVVIFERGEGPETVIEGFTLTGGRGTARCAPCVRRGGAVWITDASPTLKNLRIVENAAAAGGGIFIGEGAAPALEGLRVLRNDAEVGGGVLVSEGAAPRFIGCEIRSNLARNGGGVFLASGSDALFEDCHIAVNRADEGGGATLEGNAARFARTRIAGNEAKVGGGLVIQFGAAPVLESVAIFGNAATQLGGGFFCAGSEPVLRDVLIAWNSAEQGAAFHAERSRLDIDRSTIARNRGSKLTGVISIQKPLRTRLRSSIVWDNTGFCQLVLEGQCSCRLVLEGKCEASWSAVEVSSSCLDDDPLFCGWQVAEGDAPRGGPEAAYAALHEFFESNYSFALAEGSPCRGTGEDGADMGASFTGGACGGVPAPYGGAENVRIRLGAGRHPMAAFTLQGGLSIQGAGWEQTTLTGTVHGLGGDAELAGVTVTSGSEGGVWVESGSPMIRDCRVARNAGTGVSVSAGTVRIEGCLIVENFGSGLSGSLTLTRSTVARNAWLGLATTRSTIDRSVVWGNGGGSFFSGAEISVTSSVVEGGWTGGVDVVTTPPGFCGWTGATEVDVASQEDLDRFFERADYSYALVEGASILGQGIGAETGSCAAPGAERVALRLAEGSFEVASLLLDVEVTGAGARGTLITGALSGPRLLVGSHVTIENVAVAGSIEVIGTDALLRGVDLAGLVRVHGVHGGSTVTTGVRFEDCLLRAGSISGRAPPVVDVWQAELELDHCTVAGGKSVGVAASYGARVAIPSSIVWGNWVSLHVQPADPRVGPAGELAVSFSCIERGATGPGNIAADPRFCGAQAGEVVVPSSDLRLQANSPCLAGGAGGTRMGADRGTCAAADLPFRRGEANGDGAINVSDALKILGALFSGGAAPGCTSSADVNDDARVDISDPVALLGWLFLGTAEPAAPFAACGLDPTADALPCRQSPACE